MNPSAKLMQTKAELLQAMAALGPMRKGSLSDQYVRTTLKDGRSSRRGPYTLYTFKEGGQTVSRRITDRAQIALYRQQIEAFRRWQQLSAELVAVSQRLADLEAAGQDGGKKNSRR